MPKAIHTPLLAAGVPEGAHHLSRKPQAAQYDTLLAPQCHLQGDQSLMTLHDIILSSYASTAASLDHLHLEKKGVLWMLISRAKRSELGLNSQARDTSVSVKALYTPQTFK